MDEETVESILEEELEENADVTLLARLMDDGNNENIVLFDEDGDPVELEQIAVLPFEDEVYAILRPLDADEDAAAVFLVNPEDEESISVVEDEELATRILEEYNDNAGGEV